MALLSGEVADGSRYYSGVFFEMPDPGGPSRMDPQPQGQPMQATGAPVLFVYYKIDPAQEAALLALVKSFQQHVLARWPHLSCELMQRPGKSFEGQRTWMEVYRHGDFLSEQIIADIARLAFEMQLPAPRLSELFIPLK